MISSIDSVSSTIAIEDSLHLSFGEKLPLVIERGSGVDVWDENEKQYLDFTSGWGVTCLGHAHPVITEALLEQATKIIQNPNSGLTYSPARARLLTALRNILPEHLTKIFFVNSGAEANDAAIKLARKVTGKKTIISAEKSFHGRTLATLTATGQAIYRDRFNVLVPHVRFVPFNDCDAVARTIDDDTAAVIVEPIQGEGGVIVPSSSYLRDLTTLCHSRGVLLILDEIQTGFFRTGPAFVSCADGVMPDILTSAKGIAGGFPFAAVAVSDYVASRLHAGDHGGTYCGNPLGCAVAAAVIEHLVDENIEEHVNVLGRQLMKTLRQWQLDCPTLIRDVRGKGLLVALDLSTPQLTSRVNELCLAEGLILNVKHGTIIRIFPALTITREELADGLAILWSALQECSETL